MKAFFRRFKAGQKPGFPRFRSKYRYNSLECLSVGKYLTGDRVRIPNLGTIRCRGRLLPEGEQRALRVIRRATGWYAQVILDDGRMPPVAKPVNAAIGVDVGLLSFATLSDGTKIDNPRFGRLSAKKLQAVQRRVSRRVKGSNRRRKAVKAIQRQHERIADQRKYFCHQHSTALVRKFDLIGIENLNVAGMARSRFGKSILDAAWNTFTAQLTVKADYAGRQVVAVNPRGTSQECPNCGAIVRKKLSEREHRCPCGCVMDRDQAAAQIILARALVVSGAIRPWTDPASDVAPVVPRQAGRQKRVN
jgi:putative transposase